MDWFNAHFVAKGGYNQIEGIYFEDTFCLVIYAITIRAVLSSVITLNRKIKELDIKNAYLHENLKKAIFLEQPPDFKILSSQITCVYLKSPLRSEASLQCIVPQV